MDGNEWQKNWKKREFGHKNGTKSVRECINASLKMGIKDLTL